MSRRVKNKQIYFIVLGFFSLVLIGLFFAFTKSIVAPVGQKEAQEFVVDKGQSAKSIAEKLEERGLIRTRYGFRYALKKLGLENKLQAGTYTLSPSMDAYEIAAALTLGISDIKVTIPEGYRLEQIAEVVEGKLGIPYLDFVTAAKGEEGYLFPDTYLVRGGADATEVVKLMKNNFSKKFGALDQKTIILASLVERETKTKAEKFVVAGILEKRLNNGWPLELDATMQYIVGKRGDWWPTTTLADRKLSSPYNTYLNSGLPPTPICNPGSDSIQAVLNPQASNYWFYLHDRSGSIRYATTNSEHSANIDKYLR